MCGISGYSYKIKKDFPDDSLALSRDMITHRGPDDSGLFEDDSRGIGLAHTRLSILDLSDLGHQPMISGNNLVVLVFNGEIYNYQQLRSNLEKKGFVFRGQSDTEVLLNLYLSYRDSPNGAQEMLRQLNGIFAFAIWDAVFGTLLLARDALGVKPLYYSTTNKGVVFASELKALKPLAHEASSLDLASIDRYVTFLWCPGDGTPLENVKKLCPGELLWIKNGEIEDKVFWYRLPAFGTPQPVINKTEAVKGTLDHLRKAVHRQLVADVPVGAFLSGGLDSSSVVALAKERNPDIRCFTIDLVGSAKDGFTDDLPYARRVAAHLGVQLDVVSVNSSLIVRDLAYMVEQLDEPLADPAPLNVLYISRLARQQGIKVLLSGVGGDDLFSGYRRHLAVNYQKYTQHIPRFAKSLVASAFGKIDINHSLVRRIHKVFRGSELDGDARLIDYFVWSGRQDILQLYTPEFRSAVVKAEYAAPMLDFLSYLPNGLGSLERVLALEQRFFLADHNLIYTDKMSMAAGVEVRVPFLDLELVEFAQRIPSCFKQRGIESKWVLKKAMEPYLPKSVIYRSKTGFGSPLRQWIRFELRDLVSDLLNETSLRRRGLFDPIAVQKMIDKNNARAIDASYTIFSLICIELWCRRYLDRV